VKPARYRLLSADEQALLKPAELAKYQAERRAFADEVALHREHIQRHGWLDVGMQGREVRFHVPVVLKQHAGRP